MLITHGTWWWKGIGRKRCWLNRDRNKAVFLVVGVVRKATFWPVSGLKEGSFNSCGISAKWTLLHLRYLLAILHLQIKTKSVCVCVCVCVCVWGGVGVEYNSNPVTSGTDTLAAWLINHTSPLSAFTPSNKHQPHTISPAYRQQFLSQGSGTHTACLRTSRSIHECNWRTLPSIHVSYCRSSSSRFVGTRQTGKLWKSWGLPLLKYEVREQKKRLPESICETWRGRISQEQCVGVCCCALGMWESVSLKVFVHECGRLFYWVWKSLLMSVDVSFTEFGSLCWWVWTSLLLGLEVSALVLYVFACLVLVFVRVCLAVRFWFLVHFGLGFLFGLFFLSFLYVKSSINLSSERK